MHSCNIFIFDNLWAICGNLCKKQRTENWELTTENLQLFCYIEKYTYICNLKEK